MTGRMLAVFAFAGLLLGACSSGPDLPKLTDEELKSLEGQIAPTTQVRVNGVTYAVSRKYGQDGVYLIRTIGQQPGTRKGAFTALRRLYGCQQANLKELKEPWVRAEATASFCKTQLQ